MATKSKTTVCPLCGGDASAETKDGSQFLHARCSGNCHNEFIIGNTAMRQLNTAGRGEVLRTVRARVSLMPPPGKIHVVAWNLREDRPELSIENRDSWVNR